MKLYLFTPKNCGYDDYDRILVRAVDSKAARKLVAGKFENYQNPIKIQQIKYEGKAGILLEEFHAG